MLFEIGLYCGITNQPTLIRLWPALHEKMCSRPTLFLRASAATTPAVCRCAAPVRRRWRHRGFGNGDALLPVVAGHLHFNQLAGGEAGVGFFDNSLGESLFADEHGGAQLVGLLFEAVDVFVAECCHFIDWYLLSDWNWKRLPENAERAFR